MSMAIPSSTVEQLFQEVSHPTLLISRNSTTSVFDSAEVTYAQFGLTTIRSTFLNANLSSESLGDIVSIQGTIDGANFQNSGLILTFPTAIDVNTNSNVAMFVTTCQDVDMSIHNYYCPTGHRLSHTCDKIGTYKTFCPRLTPLCQYLDSRDYSRHQSNAELSIETKLYNNKTNCHFSLSEPEFKNSRVNNQYRNLQQASASEKTDISFFGGVFLSYVYQESFQLTNQRNVNFTETLELTAEVFILRGVGRLR
jgi:hypothetical protein